MLMSLHAHSSIYEVKWLFYYNYCIESRVQEKEKKMTLANVLFLALVSIWLSDEGFFLCFLGKKYEEECFRFTWIPWAPYLQATESIFILFSTYPTTAIPLRKLFCD